jgi:hypothetical protein
MCQKSWTPVSTRTTEHRAISRTARKHVLSFHWCTKTYWSSGNTVKIRIKEPLFFVVPLIYKCIKKVIQLWSYHVRTDLFFHINNDWDGTFFVSLKENITKNDWKLSVEITFSHICALLKQRRRKETSFNLQSVMLNNKLKTEVTRSN